VKVVFRERICALRRWRLPISSPAWSPMSLLAAKVLVFSSPVLELVRGVGERGVQSPWRLITRGRIAALIP